MEITNFLNRCLVVILMENSADSEFNTYLLLQEISDPFQKANCFQKNLVLSFLETTFFGEKKITKNYEPFVEKKQNPCAN